MLPVQRSPQRSVLLPSSLDSTQRSSPRRSAHSLCVSNIAIPVIFLSGVIWILGASLKENPPCKGEPKSCQKNWEQVGLAIEDVAYAVWATLASLSLFSVCIKVAKGCCSLSTSYSLQNDNQRETDPIL